MESRDVPALFAVQLVNSVAGDTAAIITNSLTANTALPTDSTGATLVEANSAQEAVGLAITGTITVQYAGQTLTYTVNPGTIGASASEHLALVYVNGVLQLEDMAHSVGGSDWDFNDHLWTINVSVVSPLVNPPPYPQPSMVWLTAGANTTEASPSNGWFEVHRNNTAGELTVNFAAVASTAPNAATLDVDYTILGNGSSVTFAAGAAEAMIYIHPFIDAIGTQYEQLDHPEWPYESEIELITLTLLSGSGYSSMPNQAVIQLGNDKLVFDLDVNANGSLADAVDLAKNYLPGYEGDTAKVSTGTSFNTAVYTGQRMKLIVDGAGKNSVDHIDKIEFIIDLYTIFPGYAGNRSDPTLEGAGNTEDYSFRRNGREGADTGVASKITVDREVDSSNNNMHGGAYGGKVEDNSTWVNFWCKDYAGASRLSAKIYIKDEKGGADRVVTKTLSVPVDEDGDSLADKWEIAMGARWSAQYGLAAMTNEAALLKFDRNAANDNELADPDKDGTTQAGPLRAQAETGDAHTVFEEYRGYILDGGGLNGVGAGGHAGGHIRLDPARKEILVEVDRAAVINPNNIPEGELPAIMNGASGVFSNATRGAGIYMYWLMDETTLDLPKEKVDDNIKRKAAWKTSRDTVAERISPTPLTLTTDFTHLIFVDDSGDIYGTGGNSYNGGIGLDERGSMIAVTELRSAVARNDLDPGRFDEFLMTTVAHEITHMLYKKNTGAFTLGDHTWNANGNETIRDAEDQSCLMYDGTSRPNVELASVRFFGVLQVELKVKSNRALVV